MRYPASEKLEIIRTVEGITSADKANLDMLGISRTTFYRWYDLYLESGLDGLSDNLHGLALFGTVSPIRAVTI